MKNYVLYEKLLHQLAQIPHNMISNNHQYNRAEFVLHELCSSNCFNIRKAAYLVNNKDFKCLRGIAGFYQPEAFLHEESIWKRPEKFSLHMENASFNKKVRNLNKENLILTEDKHSNELMQSIAKDLELEDPEFWTTNLKYDNTGLLIYQKLDHPELTDYLNHGFSFLGLCPLF
jgi:hypothetical protein